ncbi:MAG: helix-turn-helix domain-containing protein [Terracidiphilus sp.]
MNYFSAWEHVFNYPACIHAGGAKEIHADSDIVACTRGTSRTFSRLESVRADEVHELNGQHVKSNGVGVGMAANEWDSDLMTVAETVRVPHVPRICEARPANLALPLKLTSDELNLKFRASWNGVNMETEWLTANEAAQYLKVKPRTLLQWARERKIPAHRLSGVQRCVWRFRKHELDAILCSSSAGPAEGRQ